MASGPGIAQWYQTETTVNASIRLKKSEGVKPQFDTKHCAVYVGDDLYWESYLVNAILPAQCTMRIGKVRTELKMKKAEPILWDDYEAQPPPPPPLPNGPEATPVMETSPSPSPNPSTPAPATTVPSKQVPPASKSLVSDSVYLNYLTHDMLDTGGDKVQVMVMVGGVKENTFNVNFQDSYFRMEFQTLDERFLSSYPGSKPSTVFVWKVQLFGEIVPSGCSYEVKASKVKLSLQKAQSQRWKALEANQHLSSLTSSTTNSNSSPTNQVTPMEPPFNQNAAPDDDWNDLDADDEAEDTPHPNPQHTTPPQTQPERKKSPLGNPSQPSGAKTSRAHSSSQDQERKGSNAVSHEPHRNVQVGETSVVSPQSTHRNSGSSTVHTHAPTCTSMGRSHYACGHASPSQIETSDPSYREKQVRQASTTGLCNQGNTCFMNSVIQCLSNTPELRDYFISGRYLANVNKENPLGFQGELAKCFSLILRKLWSGEYEYFPPKKLKAIIAKRSKHFDGYSQHDSHEFMSYLLDGLHEDLNRVRKKPVTKPVEMEGHPDREVAAESWRVYKKRNNSVMVDLFQGLFKSTLVCPDCDKESVTFDPFLSLSVPIPRNLRRLPVIFVPQDPNCMPRQLILQLPHEASLELLKASVARRMSLSMTQLRVFEAYRGKFQTLMSNNRQPISQIGENDLIIVSEVLSEHKAGDKVVEVRVIQRVQVAPFPSKCAYCGSCAENGRKLQRCSSCKAVGYCDRQCQTKDWSEHRLKCKGGQPSPIGLPFVISLPAKQLTLAKLREYVERFASHSVTVERKLSPVPAQREATPQSEDMDTSIQGSADSMQELGKSGQSSGNGIQDSAKDVQSPEESMQECAESMQEKPMYTLIQVDRFADSIPEAKPLEEQDDEPLSFDGKKVYLAMDWKNNPKDADSVVVTAKNTMDYVKDEKGGLLSSKEDTVSLTQCLQLFTEPETLSEEEAWYCPRCKEHRQATKQMSVWRLPRYLIIHLKRFSFHNYVWRSKIDDYVSFPLRGLDMSPYLLGDAINEIPPGVPPLYDLHGVVNHYGNVYIGHNFAMVKPPDIDSKQVKEWLCYDDEKVWRVNEDKVVSPQAYVLFYHLRGSMTSS